MLSNYKVGTKIGAGFAIVLLLTIVVALMAYTNINKVNKYMDEATGLRTNELIHTYDMQASLSDMVMAVRGYALYKDDKYLTQFNSGDRAFRASSDKLSKLLTSEKAKVLMRDIRDNESAYTRLFDEKIVPDLKSGNKNAAMHELSEGETARVREATLQECKEMVQIIQTLMHKSVSTAFSVSSNAVKTITFFATLAVILGAFVSVVIVKTIVNPVSVLVGQAKRIAGGDLTVNVETNGKDEISQLGRAFEGMVHELRDTLKQVSGASYAVASSSQQLKSTSADVSKSSQQIAETIEQVAAGSTEQSKLVQSGASAMEQLSRAVQEVAQGAQSQAKSVDETVNIIQQITSSVEEVAKITKDAASSVEQVTDVATTGGQQVAEAVDGFDRIKFATDKVAELVTQLGSSSEQIGAIVETIDDIAEQTNLLALNAAIEAARAGEHGKGFAVVADEVRKLAERSSKATGEIAELIGHIQQMTSSAVEAMNKGNQEVESGTQLGKQAGEALSRIQEAIAGIVNHIGIVSSAADHMSEASSEVIKAIENVSAITEETTASAEEMSASTSEVMNQIQQVAAVSQENAASSEEVAATTQQQSAGVQELTASAEELSKMANDLQGVVARFKLDEDNVPSATRIDERSSDIWRKAA